MSLSTASSESLSSPRSCASMLSLPLSLQDTCRLHITMCLDEFPIEMLSLLPLKIRRRLLNGLACVDVLHLEGTPVTNGVDLDFNGMRRYLLKDLLRCSCLQDMFGINFIQDQDELLPYWHKEKGKEIPNEYIASIYQSCCNWHGSILPHRFLQYLSFDYGELNLTTSSFGNLVEHCKVQQAGHRNSVEVDCIAFSETVFWRDYLIHSYKRKPAYNASVDVAYATTPLQAAFRGIETLCLACNSSDTDNVETAKSVSYVILHNIATSKHPCLKYLSISSAQAQLGVSRLLFESKYGKFAAPYLLESLSFSYYGRPDELSVFGYQLSHLKRLVLNFRQPKTKSQLHQEKACDTLVTFLKQPQFQSLKIVRCPLSMACKLVEAFLTTPTTMEQKLNISDDHFENTRDAMPPISQPVPESSAQFKCLELAFSSNQFFAWFYSLSELKLKSLKLYDSRIPSIKLSPQAIIQVRNVELLGPNLTSPNNLDKFLVSNHALKTLGVLYPDDCFYPALNHCLSVLCQQEGRGLEELYMEVNSFQRVNLNEFFTVIRDLSLQFGTTLVLVKSSRYVHHTKFFSEEQVCSMLPDLSSKFQTKKIKRIICKAKADNLEKFKEESSSSLKLIADHVEFSVVAY